MLGVPPRPAASAAGNPRHGGVLVTRPSLTKRVETLTGARRGAIGRSAAELVTAWRCPPVSGASPQASFVDIGVLCSHINPRASELCRLSATCFAKDYLDSMTEDAHRCYPDTYREHPTTHLWGKRNHSFLALSIAADPYRFTNGLVPDHTTAENRKRPFIRGSYQKERGSAGLGMRWDRLCYFLESDRSTGYWKVTAQPARAVWLGRSHWRKAQGASGRRRVHTGERHLDPEHARAVRRSAPIEKRRMMWRPKPLSGMVPDRGARSAGGAEARGSNPSAAVEDSDGQAMVGQLYLAENRRVRGGAGGVAVL